MSDVEEKPLEINAPFFYSDDFTFFQPRGEAETLFPDKGDPRVQKLLEKTQWDEAVCLKSSGTSLKGRLHVSRCFRGRAFSCCFRANPGQKANGAVNRYHLQSYAIENSGYNPVSRSKSAVGAGRATHPGPAGQPQKTARFLTTLEALCDIVGAEVFENPSDLNGLVIVSGATAVGKSQIARALIYKRLQKLVGDRTRRRPHLVTFEDPIDVYWAESFDRARETGVDYTPCEAGEGNDATSLREAVDGALRQTPTVFFAGETRRVSDWKELLRFAATGHLAVTTSHAGSLSEAMGQLLRATRAENAAARSEIAKRLLAVIHLKSGKAEVQSGTTSYIVPSIWTKTAFSAKTFMADGLTSLLPYRDKRSLGCLGRAYFAEKLLQVTGLEDMPFEEKAEVIKQIKCTTLSWDLQGI